MNIALWVVQGLLAAVFLMVGGMKVFAYEKFAQSSKKGPEDKPIAKGLARFIGTCELAGALGLVLPWVTGILPQLTAFAALGIATIMVLAAGYHSKRKEPQAVMMTLVLCALAGFVAYGRWMF